MKKLLALLSLSLILSGCSSINRNVSNLVFPPYGDSDQREGESVTLNLEYQKGEDPANEWTIEDIKKSCSPKPVPVDENIHAFAALESVTGGLTAASVLQLATKQVQEFLKKEAERYTGSYSAMAVGDHFYTRCIAPDDSPEVISAYPGVIHLNRINLVRSLPNDERAMELSFSIEPTIDNTAFQIKPETIEIKKSKAKITAFDITKPFGFDILAPWTIFQAKSFSPARLKKVDVTAEISVTAVWVDSAQKAHSEVIASRKFNFGSIPLGKIENLKEKGFSPQLFPAIPRSVMHRNTLGQPVLLGPGNFIVSVLVTEYDDYAERVMELEQGIDKNRDSFINRLTGDI